MTTAPQSLQAEEPIRRKHITNENADLITERGDVEPSSDNENSHAISPCPFSQGDIRLIVSEGETLGPAVKNE